MGRSAHKANYVATRKANPGEKSAIDFLPRDERNLAKDSIKFLNAEHESVENKNEIKLT